MHITVLYSSEMDRQNIEKALDEAVAKFQRSCAQVRILSSYLNNLQVRYERARRDGQRHFRYTLRLKIATAEGVRNAFYEYACVIGAEVEDLQLELANLCPGAIIMC